MVRPCKDFVAVNGAAKFSSTVDLLTMQYLRNISLLWSGERLPFGSIFSDKDAYKIFDLCRVGLPHVRSFAPLDLARCGVALLAYFYVDYVVCQTTHTHRGLLVHASFGWALLALCFPIMPALNLGDVAVNVRRRSFQLLSMVCPFGVSA